MCTLHEKVEGKDAAADRFLLEFGLVIGPELAKHGVQRDFCGGLFFPGFVPSCELIRPE